MLKKHELSLPLMVTPSRAIHRIAVVRRKDDGGRSMVPEWSIASMLPGLVFRAYMHMQHACEVMAGLRPRALAHTSGDMPAASRLACGCVR